MNKELIEAEKKALEEQLRIGYIQCHQLEGAIAILTKLLKEEPKPGEQPPTE